MNIDISPRAYEDLREIKQYISRKLLNPSSASETIEDLLKSIRSLGELPDRGAPLNTLVPINSKYRFIQCRNYAIFYRVEEERVFISRVLYKYRNFFRIFFPEEQD